MILNYQILHIYERSAKQPSKWTERRNDMDELGNNVFDSHDVESESSTMTTALQVFNKHLTHSMITFQSP